MDLAPSQIMAIANLPVALTPAPLPQGEGSFVSRSRDLHIER